MRLPKKSKYPKKLLIGDNEYRIVFVDRIEGVDTLGMCDPETNVIFIKNKLSDEERFNTLCHEILHAFEFEYDLDIPHKHIYALEKPILEFLLNNF